MKRSKYDLLFEADLNVTTLFQYSYVYDTIVTVTRNYVAITVNVTVLQCNWLQNTENLLIQVDSKWYGIVSV